MASIEVSEDTQITCKFTTKLPAEFRVPETSVAVPSKLTRYGLSQVINHLLALVEARPFDFLIKGELVRLSLERFLLAHDISAESLLEVEYIFATVPPDFKTQLPHNDWVGAVDGGRSNVILSGSYDGLVKVWNGTGECISSTCVHKGPISALASLPEAQGSLALSAGKLDQVIRLLQVPQFAEGASDSQEELSAVAVYRGHSDSVSGAAASPSGDLFVTCSYDRSLRIWQTGASIAAEAADQPAAAAPKRKKKRADDGQAVMTGGAEQSQRAQLDGHTDAATSVAWTEAGVIYSGSMDHSVRKWDAETGINTDTHNGRKAVSCVAAPAMGRDLVAFGGAERALHLWDPRRRQAEDAGVKNFASHESHIHAVAWHPTSEHHVVSASLDKTVKMWDLRAPIPLHTLQGHTEQVLCATWWRTDHVVSGSADNTIRIYTAELN